MSRVAFLLDEHVPAAVGYAFAGLAPLARHLHIGIDPAAPPKRTPDPDVLAFAERERMAVVTFDKETMPNHAIDHTTAGRTLWGLFVVPNGNDLNAGTIARELHMIWDASQAEEWVGRTEFIPY